MANALRVDIKPGSVVRVAVEHFWKPVPPKERRYFVAEDGFGMSSITSGQTIIGYWQYNGKKNQIEGYMIDRIVSEPEDEQP